MSRFDARARDSHERLFFNFTTAQTLAQLVAARTAQRLVLQDVILTMDAAGTFRFASASNNITAEHHVTADEGFKDENMDLRCNLGEALNFTTTGSGNVGITIYFYARGESNVH